VSKTLPFTLTLGIALVLSAPVVSAGRSVEIDVGTERPNALLITGPIRLHFVRVNRLRYQVMVGDDVSLLQGANLAALQPPLPGIRGAVEGSGAPVSQDTSSAAARTATPGGMMQDSLSPGSLEEDLQNKVVNPGQKVLDRLAQAVMQLEATVASSDAVLTVSGGEDTLVAAIGAVRDSVQSALNVQWPMVAIVDLSTRIAVAKSRVAESLRSNRTGEPGKASARKARVIAVLLDSLEARLAKWRGDGEYGVAYRTMRSTLSQWLRILVSLANRSSFELDYHISHPASRSDGSSHHVAIRRTDRLPQLRDHNASLPPTEVIDVASVRCDPRWSVSTGWLFSDLSAVDYQAVTDTAGVRVVGYRSRGGQNAPVALISFRLSDMSTSIVDFYFSVGPVLNIAESNSSLGVGFLGGLTLAVARKLYLTVGAHRGQERELDDSFTMHGRLPEQLSAPTTHQRWRTSLAWAASIEL